MSGGRVRRMMICQSRRRRETRDSSERSESSPAPLKQRGLVANNTGTGSGFGRPRRAPSTPNRSAANTHASSAGPLHERAARHDRRWQARHPLRKPRPRDRLHSWRP